MERSNKLSKIVESDTTPPTPTPTQAVVTVDDTNNEELNKKHLCLILILIHMDGIHSIFKTRISNLSESQLKDLMSIDGRCMADEEIYKKYEKLVGEENLFYINDENGNPIWKKDCDTIKQSLSEDEIVKPEHIITFVDWA